MKYALFVTALLLSLLCTRASAYVLFSDDFESYSPGVLDKNATASPNAAPNGMGFNPWWGPGTTPNFTVVGAQGSITPHSGSSMIRGNDTTGITSLAWNNIAYRDNFGSPFTGNLKYDFYFYDPNGATSGGSYEENSAIAYYDKAPSDTDYPTGSDPTLSNSTSNTIQRLTLGAANYKVNTAGYPQTYNSTLYQARILGYTGGYNSVGWLNLPLTRSVGWHHGEIIVGPADSTGNNLVSYYIDNMTTPLFTGMTDLPNGYNTLEFTSAGTSVGYFEDATLVTIPEPTLLALTCAALATPLSRRRRP